MPEASSNVVIIDYGSQFTQLIARRVREAGVYSRIVSCHADLSFLRETPPGALILSGGPASALAPDAPGLDPAVLAAGVPVLAICYGMQLMALALGGKLRQSGNREYGPAQFRPKTDSPLWDGLDKNASMQVWMSHGDDVIAPPPGFAITGCTDAVKIAAMADFSRNIYCLQFHPEVHHTVYGSRIIENFIFRIANLKSGWSMASFAETAIGDIKGKVGSGEVVCALSGGVDSTVTAVLLNRAIGQRLTCVFVDNGLLRQDEAAQVSSMLREHFNLNLVVIDASELFLSRLREVTDPEEKRKIIGHTFIEVFNAEAAKLKNVEFLAQGTLYPDVIESVSPKGPSAVIKSHHNVGGLPEAMKLKLIEPLRELFKDEVRLLGLELGIPEDMVWRQPFPGPGLAIRILGAVTQEKLATLREADRITREELRSAGWERKIWQGFAVLLPLQTVGVMGDDRTYEQVIALRCVESVDAMTADWARIPYEILARISSRIINEVRGVNRVVYDISSKPPSTIEWE